MSLNKNKKNNYNLIVILVMFIAFIHVLSFFMLITLNTMFYKSNFYNKNYQNNNQVVNINNLNEDEKININTCSIKALDSLGGIGETKAYKIISNRPYTDIYQIREVIGEKTFNNIKDKIKI